MKSKIFIGSSKESLNIAYAIQDNLDDIAEVTVWTQDIFKPSQYTLDAIDEAVESSDVGIFVVNNDDITQIRDGIYSVSRDNVIFELGLFIGKLGRENCFFIIPRNIENFHIPTDLMGITSLTYDSNRNDNNLKASLAPACNNVRQCLSKMSYNVHRQADYDLQKNKFPSKRLIRYLDTACLFRDRTTFNDAIGYQKLFTNTKSIHAIGISLNAITINWGINNLIAALNNLTEVKLLFLDPNGESTRIRETIENLPPGTISNITKTNLNLIKLVSEKCTEEIRNKLNYKIYDSLLNLNMYILDEKFIILQHYLTGIRGQECPIYVLKNEQHENGLFDLYKSVFDSTWNKVASKD